LGGEKRTELIVLNVDDKTLDLWIKDMERKVG
jgi:hypothetical protein